MYQTIFWTNFENYNILMYIWNPLWIIYEGGSLSQLVNVYVYAWLPVCMIIKGSLILFRDKYHNNSATGTRCLTTCFALEEK